MPILRSSSSPSYPRREDIIHIPRSTYGLISALQSATKTLQQQQQNDNNTNPTLEYSIQLRVPTRDPALDEEQIENSGLDDIKILPHWREFVGALRSYNPNDQVWCFYQITMSPALLNILLPAMMSRNIHTLEFEGKSGDSVQNNLNNQFVCGILESRTSNIKRLIFRQNTCLNDRLYKAIENHPSLEELHFTNMKVGRVDGMLQKILNTSRRVKYLNFNNNVIGAADTATQGGMEISQLLKYDQSLEHLNLGNTGLTDDDVVLIADALKFDIKLRVLSLGGKKRRRKTSNEITSRGRKALSEVLFNASNLDTVANSNHTCRVDVASDLHLHTSADPCPHEDLLNILNKGSPKDNRRWKVLSALYATNGLGITQNEFETYQNLKVIPELLAFITAFFEGEELHTHETILVGDEIAHINLGPHGDVLDKLFGGLSDENGASSTSSIFPSLTPLFPPSTSGKKEADENSSDELSVESDESFDSYDSELEDLDDAFEEEEDEVYESFEKSFFDPSFCGERARLTIMFQVVQKWGLPLLDKSPPLPKQPVAAGEDGKQKRKRATSWKCEPDKKGKKTSRHSLKKGSKEAVISQREIDSLAD